MLIPELAVMSAFCWVLAILAAFRDRPLWVCIGLWVVGTIGLYTAIVADYHRKKAKMGYLERS